MGFGAPLIHIDAFGEDRLETALLVLVVKHDDRCYMQDGLAIAAVGHLTLQILQKPVSKMVFRPFMARRLGAATPAMRANELHFVFLGIAIQRRPAGISNPYGLFRLFAHGIAPVFRLSNLLTQA